MHPVIRIVCYLVLAVFLARANVAQLIFSALGLSALFLVTRPAQFGARLGRALYRLKWLFLSIVVLYLWFTPPDLPAGGATGFNLAALQMGVIRVAVLVLLIWGVLYVLNGLSRAQLLGAIYFLASPLRLLGANIERFALRLALTLQAVDELQSQQNTPRSDNPDLPAWQRVVGRVNEWFELVRQRAETTALVPQSLPAVMRPPLWQWAYPLALAAVYAALQFINTRAWI